MRFVCNRKSEYVKTRRVRAPLSLTDAESYLYECDGALLVADGKIKAISAYTVVKAPAPEGLEEIEHRPHLILPGFIDLHMHFPQMQGIASYAANLLEWLNTYTFPEECRFVEVSTRPASPRGSTTNLSATARQQAISTGWCRTKATADAVFAEALKRGMCMVGGKVMVDGNTPQVCSTRRKWDMTRGAR
ncbi:amidohydrolase family protein [Neorhizobium sp. SHOUNA12A]|nr:MULTISPECIES: amidohydrolase family protein [unclassified Neorhizobium]MCJ9669437.1 amidohydrolase family protein [Neorhizobium sp. SHOUNA12B]MCJ9745538.1 amidohydrolase family protein [Neorhizobium sp. SHOUNA12A]